MSTVEPILTDPCGCVHDAETGFTIKPCAAHQTPHERLLAAAKDVLAGQESVMHDRTVRPGDLDELAAAVAECEAPPVDERATDETYPLSRGD